MGVPLSGHPRQRKETESETVAFPPTRQLLGPLQTSLTVNKPADVLQVQTSELLRLHGAGVKGRGQRVDLPGDIHIIKTE